MWCDVAANHSLLVHSFSWTAQVAVGQDPDGPLPPLLTPLLPPASPQSRARHCVYSPNYRGGAGWQASHHRFPTGLGLGTLQTPATVSQMWLQCPTVTGEPLLAKPKGRKRDIKDRRGIGRVGTNRGYAWEVEVGSWGHRQSVIQSNVEFERCTNTDLNTHTPFPLLLSNQGRRVTCTRQEIRAAEPPNQVILIKVSPATKTSSDLYFGCFNTASLPQMLVSQTLQSFLFSWQENHFQSGSTVPVIWTFLPSLCRVWH